MLKRTAIEANSLVLTFDEGPSDRFTNEILNFFNKYEVKATFFLLGKMVESRQDIARQIAQGGHEICSHGYDHINYLKVSPWRAIADIKRGWKTIDAALGQKLEKYPFRPPYGKLNIICLLYLLIKRVPIVYWTFDCGDTWKIKPSCHIIKEAVKKGGAVTLAHGCDRYDGTNEFVLDSIQSALVVAKDKGMQILTVSELLDSN
jgi:peptidoglycan/xylan/chitin deacetylase (PgdA/CDA1 family)